MTCTVLCQIIYKKFSSHTIQFNISKSQRLCFPELCSRTLCWYETFVVLRVMGCPISVWICNICAANHTHILPLSQALDPSHSHSLSFITSIRPSFSSLKISPLPVHTLYLIFQPAGIWVLVQLSGLLYLGGSGCPCRGLTEALQTFIEGQVIRVLIHKDSMNNTTDPGAHTQSKADSEHGKWARLLIYC